MLWQSWRRRSNRWQVWQLGAASGKGNGNLNSSVSSQTAATSRQLPPRVFERRPTSLASRFEFIFLGMAWRSPKAQTASYWAADRIRAVRAK